jgi:predicted nuclease of predicted toxin-antitoxin system
MRWLLDQGLPRSATKYLNDSGHDAIHTGDIGMASASDSSILKLAAVESRIIVTLDSDFHALLAVSGATKPSVTRIREEGLKGEALARIVSAIALQYEVALLSGCVMSYQDGKVRYRSLPL